MRGLLSTWLRRLPRRERKASGPALEAELDAAFDTWMGDWPRMARLYVNQTSESARTLAAICPAQARACVSAADRILRHDFDLLGSGAYVPSDPRRTADASGYGPVDWSLDPVSRRRFPEGVPHSRWDFGSMTPSGADIKLPWELGRCQHWVPLAQAYRMTGDDRYAAEIAAQLRDFVEANPTGLGVQWTCTMDVALRAANWALALALVRESAAWPADAWRLAHTALGRHGAFIFDNLENKYEVTSNHFLSNVVGLSFVAAALRPMPSAERWASFCREALENEIRTQVLDDGADFESSLPYHRLVTELFLGAARLAQCQNAPLSAEYHERLRTMVDFLVDTLRPDGLMPQVGDADDGRLHVFTDYGAWCRQDPRTLLGPAGRFFDRPDWSALAGADGVWEAAWWGFPPSTPLPRLSPASVFRLFPQAGIAVMREAGDYVLVTNGVVGTKGFGNHKHNDQLAFECHLAGHPLFVDPGSFVYTPDPEARNLFRSAGYHNTLIVDEREPNDVRPEWLFRMFETARPETLAFDVTESYVEYRGRHVGYARFDPPVVHERAVRLRRGAGGLAIRDRLLGSGAHRLRWHWHAAPGVRIHDLGGGQFQVAAGSTRFRLTCPPGCAAAIRDVWYSPSYGTRLPSRALDLTLEAALSVEAEWTFELRLEESPSLGARA